MKYRILWRFNNVGDKVYLPQIKGWFLWSRVPLQRPSSIDESNSPWNSNLFWCRKQIETHYTRSKLSKRTGIIERVNYEEKIKPDDRPYCGICASFDIDNVRNDGYSYCNERKISVHKYAVVCEDFGI